MVLKKASTIEYEKKMKYFENEILIAKNGLNPVKDLLRASRELNDFFEDFKSRYELTKPQRKEYKKNRMVAKTFGRLVKTKEQKKFLERIK